MLSLSLRCGCPVDTSAKQKHRPSRQARPPQGVRQSVSPLLVIVRGFSPVAIRFSFKGELRILSRYAFRMTSRLVIAKPCKRLWQSVFLLRGITDSFTLRVQNDIPFSHCEAVQTAVAIRSPCHYEKKALISTTLYGY